MSVQYLTEEHLEKLKQELENLIRVERPRISQQIAEAREKGDLSENAEYDAAKDAQGLLELKISKLQAVVGNARIIDVSKVDTSKAALLTKVKVRNIKMKKDFVYTLVSENEANIKESKLSIQSPIGAAIFGKTAGEKVEVRTPGGLMEFEILEITI
jgi:transcription elongation factor GreA